MCQYLFSLFFESFLISLLFIHSSETQNDDLHQNLQDYQQPTNSDSPTKVLLNKSESNENVIIEYLEDDDLIFADSATNDFQTGITTGLSTKVMNIENKIANEMERFASDGVANVISAASDASSERWVERIRMNLKKDILN